MLRELAILYEIILNVKIVMYYIIKCINTHYTHILFYS